MVPSVAFVNCSARILVPTNKMESIGANITVARPASKMAIVLSQNGEDPKNCCAVMQIQRHK